MLITQPVAHQCIDPVIGSAEAPQLYSLSVLNFLRVRVSPLNGDVAVGVCVDEDVESAITSELREEGDGSCDLAEDGGDLGLDLGFGLIGGDGGGGIGRVGIFLVVGGGG